MNKVRRYLALGLAGVMSAVGMWAQNSAPAPGSGGGFNPAPANGIGWNPGPGATSAPAPGSGGGYNPGPGGPGGPGWNGPAWGGPWGPGWNSTPSVIVNLGTPNIANSGVTNVVGVGYDAQGVWRTVPMRVAYNYNGAFYNVTVLNAWNPWTDMWNRGVDQPAYNTSYLLRGQTYNFYAPLSTGTYYFNL